jgi:predicted TIM-barrel fold metal-dependent hydrolase
MHAGYPMIDNMLTLLQANSHVYVDVAGLIWSYPLKEVNRYIQRLVEAGFEDRVMFGTDQLQWPKLMTYSISVIQNADYLSPSKSATFSTTTPHGFFASTRRKLSDECQKLGRS